jgi:hypothetical protein
MSESEPIHHCFYIYQGDFINKRLKVNMHADAQPHNICGMSEAENMGSCWNRDRGKQGAGAGMKPGAKWPFFRLCNVHTRSR